MSTISLGNMFSSGGKTIISGGSSGLDSEALIKSLTDAKRLPATRIEDTIKANTTKATSLGELQSLLQKLKDAANFLRSPLGVGNESEDVFAYRSAAITTNTGVASSSYLSATVAPGTATGSYTLLVDQLATKQTRVTNTFTAADLNASIVGGAGLFNAGTLKLGPALTNVTLAAGDSINEVLSKINTVKDTSGVEASVVKISDGNYRMILKATATGTDKNFDFTANNAGLLNGGFFSETSGVVSKVTLDGTQVSRQSNTIDDLISGVTLTLNQQTPGGTSLNVDVTADTGSAKTAISNFVDAYNNFRVFVAKQTATNEDGSLKSDAVLAQNTALRTVADTLAQQIVSAVPGLTDGENSLASFGVTLTDFQGDDKTPFTRNVLQINDATLTDALSSNFDALSKAFKYSFSSNNSNFSIYSHPANLNTNSIQFNLDVTHGTYQATFNDGTGPQTVALIATALSGGGTSLTADPTGPLAGLTVIYAGNTDATPTLTFTQGIGDLVYESVKSELDSTSGIVSQEIQSITDRNVSLKKDVDAIDNQVENYRQTLLDRFSKLESAISSVNSILQLLDAQAAARNKNN